MSRKIAIVNGRFQPLHNDHFHKYIMKAWESSKCDFMYIGITNPDHTRTKHNKSDKQRSLPQNNPLTFIERLEMIRETLTNDGGLRLDQFDIVPFPIDFPGVLKCYASKKSQHYLTIFDQWGMDKQFELIQIFGAANVHVLFKGTEKDKEVTATMVRRKIKNGEDWESLVPPATAKYLKSNGMIRRIAKLQETK